MSLPAFGRVVSGTKKFRAKRDDVVICEHRNLIRALGSERNLAEELGVSQPVIGSWKKLGIPWRWRGEVALLARRSNIELPPRFFDAAQ